MKLDFKKQKVMVLFKMRSKIQMLLLIHSLSNSIMLEKARSVKSLPNSK